MDPADRPVTIIVTFSRVDFHLLHNFASSNVRSWSNRCKRTSTSNFNRDNGATRGACLCILDKCWVYFMQEGQGRTREGRKTGRYIEKREENGRGGSNNIIFRMPFLRSTVHKKARHACLLIFEIDICQEEILYSSGVFAAIWNTRVWNLRIWQLLQRYWAGIAFICRR